MPIHKFDTEDIVKPRYNDFCLNNAFPTVMKMMGVKNKFNHIPIDVEKAEKIILFFIDGFGLDLIENNQQNKFLNNLASKGDVYQITTVFPSTTAAATASFHTGLTPQEHGMFEWFMYFKEIDSIIATLPFSPINEPERFLANDPDPKMVFNSKSLHTEMADAGINSYVFVKADIATSYFTKVKFSGCIIIPYLELPDLVVNLRQIIENEKGPAYFYVYWSDIDSTGHKYGYYTEQSNEEIDFFFTGMLKNCLKRLKDIKNTKIVLTADHGQVNVKPKETTYLNKYKWFNDSLKKSKAGRLIMPYGSPRDVFLQLKEGDIANIKEKLSNVLDARVMETKDAIKQNYFGTGKMNKKFIERVGDLLILPNKEKTIWYEHVKGRKFDMNGMHGGLEKKEMLIPFAICDLKDMIK